MKNHPFSHNLSPDYLWPWLPWLQAVLEKKSGLSNSLMVFQKIDR